jgi:hypothetical protein
VSELEPLVNLQTLKTLECRNLKISEFPPSFFSAKSFKNYILTAPASQASQKRPFHPAKMILPTTASPPSAPTSWI